jgi:hypothetical protein
MTENESDLKKRLKRKVIVQITRKVYANKLVHPWTEQILSRMQIHRRFRSSQTNFF